ncbi:bifunctional phosphopantothenoylcysteine decarboxylase/phosphopantothenate--cysteine ligase CoaBC [Cyclobacterium plantarum]|uniref:Coenzyme A biosynthesis bifunctional protein CoaBC n=1 Tax=Cyclobacterium plantarum TaxID=2716263 RepID=A0ABX0H952_9BACT|nr:bifunctional phosphopantothenoylcysteine decarboxylase/phosphopantothenate--cysteine ligase CoaBC [Cyclobacterium plantarum]NHE58386.1 bifunctional phosphopantothenoylcysteine decarboxylase/phosphopantothenate--cysteine ligase CoaBC [Cyclobacterium plantarum]
MPLSGKNVLVGVTGGIAAYKAAVLIRLLIKSGAEVKVIMTTSALDFIGPLTLSTLSKNPVYIDFFNRSTGEWTNHVELGNWADLMIIAPLSANTLAKMASGQSDNLLCCTYLSCTCPVLVAPAMDLDMYRHAAVIKNLDTLRSFGNKVMEASTGDLASGLVGQGRMPEPEEILEEAKQIIIPNTPLKNKKIMITAGPTQEAIDPVRYISNHSSGKMGISIAHEAAKRGAQVTLILGPTALKPELSSIRTVHVSSAQDMFEAAKTHHKQADVAIFSAAVADYRPEKPATEKIKKDQQVYAVSLVKNPDIAQYLGKQKRTEQFHIGFALETDEGSESAKNKLLNKNLDFIVLNTLLDPEAGFQKDTNKATLIFRNDEAIKTPVMTKEKLAKIILNQLETLIGTTENK